MSRLIAKSGIDRRMALKALLAMGVGTRALAREDASLPAPKPGVGPRGTPTDPDLKDPVVPWGRTLDAEALRTLQALVDLILPADERSPAASALGAHDFIDEWVSAPYDEQQADRTLLLSGLEWLGLESQRRYGDATFANLSVEQQSKICDDVCETARAAETYPLGAPFFALVRNLTAAAVWTTEEGMTDLGYVGNVPLTRWELPPPAVMKHLGLD